MFYVYPPSGTGNRIISTALHLHNSERFPTDFFIARRNEVTANIFEVNSGSNFSNKITISNQSTDCCATVWRTTIPVFLLPGKLLQKYRIEHDVHLSHLLFFTFYFIITDITYHKSYRSSCKLLLHTILLILSDLKEHNHAFAHAQEFDFSTGVKNSKMRELI